MRPKHRRDGTVILEELEGEESDCYHISKYLAVDVAFIGVPDELEFRGQQAGQREFSNDNDRTLENIPREQSP